MCLNGFYQRFLKYFLYTPVRSMSLTEGHLVQKFFKNCTFYRILADCGEEEGILKCILCTNCQESYETIVKNIKNKNDCANHQQAVHAFRSRIRWNSAVESLCYVMHSRCQSPKYENGF